MATKRFVSITAIALAASLALNPVPLLAGDLNAEVETMFNNLGGMGNYTEAGAFRGQTMNTYVGGNVFLRAPNRVYRLSAIQFPHAKGGCGGIDIFGGSFSHISAEEFKNMLRNITSALPGIAFQLALESVSPMLGSLTKWGKGLESMINNARINSCETATALVSSVAQSESMSWEALCTKIAMVNGMASDVDQAKRLCAGDFPNILNNAAKSDDATERQMAPFTGNLTWAALKTIPNLDDPAREIVMSIVGTVVYPAPGSNRDKSVHPPTLTSVENLLYGQAANTDGNVRIQMLACDEPVECLNVTQVERIHEPLTTRVERLMRSIADKIRDRTAIANPSEEVGFVNHTSLPIWRMASIGTTIPGSQLGEHLIQNYKDVIAADYAVTFLSQFANVALAALQKQYRLERDQQSDANRLRDDTHRILARLGQQQSRLYGKVQSIASVTDNFEQLERALRSNMSQHMLEMLEYASRPLR